MLVLVISMSMTNASEEVILEQILCIQYLVKFWKNKDFIEILIDSISKLNEMSPTYAALLGFKVCFTTIGAQRFDDSFLKILI